MSAEKKEERITLRIGASELQKMDDLAEYYKELGILKSATRGELIRHALNVLFEGTRKMIEEHHYTEE